MSDKNLVMRLRADAEVSRCPRILDIHRAADRIEALAARVAKLEEAIAWYRNFDPESADEILARAAPGEAVK